MRGLLKKTCPSVWMMTNIGGGSLRGTILSLFYAKRKSPFFDCPIPCTWYSRDNYPVSSTAWHSSTQLRRRCKKHFRDWICLFTMTGDGLKQFTAWRTRHVSDHVCMRVIAEWWYSRQLSGIWWPSSSFFVFPPSVLNKIRKFYVGQDMIIFVNMTIVIW